MSGLIGEGNTKDFLKNSTIVEFFHYLLLPFEYYVIYYNNLYDTIPCRSGKYELVALENAFTVKGRTANITQNPKSIFAYNIETKIFSLMLEKKDLLLLNKYARELAYFVEDRINFRREDYVVRKKYK